jgi:uncharacterized protein YehS (DUF1456 family)
MVNNDILRRIRYTFDYSDVRVIKVFALADHVVSREQIKCWLQKEDDEGFQQLLDIELALFLNGLIIEMRGKREGPQPPPENHLNNNIILLKLKIALNLKADDILELLKLAGFPISKPELSALFRNSSHQHYRDCKDQLLRKFLNGVQMKYRPSSSIVE